MESEAYDLHDHFKGKDEGEKDIQVVEHLRQLRSLFVVFSSQGDGVTHNEYHDDILENWRVHQCLATRLKNPERFTETKFVHDLVVRF